MSISQYWNCWRAGRKVLLARAIAQNEEDEPCTDTDDHSPDSYGAELQLELFYGNLALHRISVENLGTKENGRHQRLWYRT